MVDQLFSEFDRLGLRAEIIGGALRLTPGNRIDDDLRAVLRENMLDVLARIASNGDSDVEWRLKAFLIQLQPLSPPAVLPFLVALNVEAIGKESCPSCAELRKDSDSYLCAPCVTAKRLALEMWLARPAKVERAAGIQQRTVE